MSDQLDAFGAGKSNEEVQIENAITVLEEKGYRVVRTAEEAKQEAIRAGYKVSDPILVNTKVITLLDLRNYFFMRLWKKYPNRQLYHVQGNLNQELRAFKLFVEAREQTGLNRFNAIQECVAVIDIIFDHEEEFGFKNPIDIRILGQNKAGWITQKALFILRNKIQEELDHEVDRLIEKKDKERKVDLRNRSLELDRLLSEMESNNG